MDPILPDSCPENDQRENLQQNQRREAGKKNVSNSQQTWGSNSNTCFQSEDAESDPRSVSRRQHRLGRDAGASAQGRSEISALLKVSSF